MKCNKSRPGFELVSPCSFPTTEFLYWLYPRLLLLHIDPRPSCQNKKCTRVNNWWIRSKISGDNLDCWRVELSANVTLARSRWMSNYNITPATGSSDQLERRCWNENHVPAEAGPLVEQARRTGKKCCYSQKSWGGSISPDICLVSNSPFTQEPFWIKWEVYFSKELCSLVLIVLNMFRIVGCDYKTLGVSSWCNG